MSKSVRSLDQIKVASACEADWDSMIGNDQVRFCEHCNLHVNNLSAMSRHEALRLVAQSRGRLCVRYEQRTDGELLTTHFPNQLYRIGRRASRIAATAFSATLSLSSAMAQTTASTSAPAEISRENAQSPAKAAGDAQLSCSIKDPNGAVVPGATVTLTNDQTSVESTMTSPDEGVCVFEKLVPGTYTVKAVMTGFATVVLKEVEIQPAGNLHLEIPLEVQTEVTVTMGVVAIVDPKDPLPLAAHKNDLQLVAQLARLGTDINAPDQYTGVNALDYAIENGNREMVQLLLSAGANINASNKNGLTPLMYLGDKATPELVRDLISAGAAIDACDENSETPLMNAIRSCSLPVVQQLMSSGARSDARDENGNTLLMSAAQNNDSSVLKFLLGSGVDATAKNEDGESALTLAVRWSKPQNMQALLDAGVTFDSNQDQLDELLMRAVQSDEVEPVRLLLKAGASPNAKENNTTALMYAVEYAKPDAIKLLIDAGADLAATDENGWTALMYAGDVEKVRLLLNAGADLTVKSKDGKTVLARAIENQQEDIAKFLKSRGAPQ